MHPDVQVLIDGGLRPTHVASLLGANRNTVTRWFAGGPPMKIIHGPMGELAEAVRRAIEAGKLPVPAAKLAPGEAYLRTFAIANEYRAALRREGSGTA